MMKFYKNLFIFSVPFILYSILIILIDPFCYFSLSNIIDKKIKTNYSVSINYSLWKLLRYRESPCENVILGDSRTSGLNLNKIKQYTNYNFFDFSYGGGNLTEIIHTFNILKNKYKLKIVCIGLGFNYYNNLKDNDRVEGSYEIIKNPALYFTNSDVIKSAYLCLSNYNGKLESIEKPPINKEEFWQYHLQNTASKFYSNYKFPEELFKNLIEISEYCEKNNIKLYIINYPSHNDIRDLIKKFNLSSQYTDYLKDLKSLINYNAEIVDFEFNNDLTKNKENFADAYHINKDILTDMFIKVINKNYEFDNKYVKY